MSARQGAGTGRAPGRALLWLGGAAFCLDLALALTPAAAQAQEARSRIDVDSGPPAQALVQLAIQARVSIDLAAAARCRGHAAAVHGVYSAGQALERMLAGTRCRAVRIAAGAWRIVPAPPPAAVRPPPPPAAPPPAPAPASPSALSEIVVTATKRASAIDRTPYPLSVVTGPQLQDQRIADAADLAQAVAGMTVTNLGPGRDKILIRGLSDGPLTGQVQSIVGIYLDNVRITYDAPDPDLRLIDLARVEVLKGPQGSLYGAGSIGGIVHIVTRPPDPSAASAWLSATASATQGGAPGGVLEGVLNLPVGPRSAIRIAAYDEVAGGYFDNRGLGRRNTNRTDRRGVRASLLSEVAPGWTLTAAVANQTISSADAQYGDAALPSFQRDTRLAELHDNDFATASLTAAGSTRLGRLTATSAYVHHEIDSIYDASSAAAAFGSSSPGPDPFEQDDRVEMLVNEVTFASQPGGALEWLAGAFYSRGEKDSTATLTAGPGGPNLYREDRKDLLNETAAYGEITWRATGQLRLTAGGRLFRSSLGAASTARFDAAPDRTFSGRLVDTGFAPKLVADYRPGSRLILYAQAAEGYRAGGYNTGGPAGQAFGLPGAGAQPYRRYNGDEVWNYEAGLRLNLLDGRLRLQAAAFYSVWTDIQMNQLLPSGVSYTANIGDGRVRGMETEAALQLGEVSLRANLLLNGPELVRPDPSFPSRPDSGLPGVPSVAYGGGFTWRRPLAHGLQAVVDADVSYVGGSHLTFDAFTAPVMGGYVATRASLGVAGRHWRAVLFVDNAAGDRGDTFAYGNPFTLRDFHQVTPQRPRTVGLSLSRSY